MVRAWGLSVLKQIAVLLFQMYAAFTATAGFLLMAVIPPVELFAYAGGWAALALGLACVVVALGNTSTPAATGEHRGNNVQRNG